jgi:hypothetical protein
MQSRSVTSAAGDGRRDGYAEKRDRYVRGRIADGCALAVPELRRGDWADALYRIRDRQGIDVTAVPGCSLHAQLARALARFQFAQYLAVGFIDHDVAYHERLERLDDPVADPHVALASVHFIASCSASGQLLASMTLRPAAGALPGVRFGARVRPLFPLEQHFGWGALNRLALLPQTPLARVREFGRLVKNARLASISLGARVVAELLLAATRALLAPLRAGVDACIGEFETTAVQRNLEFFHTPMVVLRGGLPAFVKGHPLNPALAGRTRRPFAFWVPDLVGMVERIDAIEAALEQRDRQAVAALAALKRVPSSAVSSLVPPGGIPRLADRELDQCALGLEERRRARRQGAALRAFAPFAELSDTEATALRTVLGQRQLDAGQPLLRRGERTATVSLIESGEVDIQPPRGQSITLDPGACVGAFGMLTGAPSDVDAVARTPVTALTLGAPTYASLLRELPDVELGLHRVALMEAAAARPSVAPWG